MSDKITKYKPFILTLSILLVDQITKMLVVAKIEQNKIGWAFGGDFFWLVHQRNPGAAFSLGDNLPEVLRIVIMIIIPIILMGGLCVFYFRTKDLTNFQRWILCGILGGGLGNIIDRIFRADGVVDFLSFNFFGIFNLQRWPAFNVADASVVVCCALLLISLAFIDLKKDKAAK